MLTGQLPPVSNQQSWSFMVNVTDKETGSNIDLTGSTIVLELRNQRKHHCTLIASTDNGKITIPETGFFQVSFLRTDMQSLERVTHDVGCIITIGNDTQQLILGSVSVLDGIVRQ